MVMVMVVAVIAASAKKKETFPNYTTISVWFKFFFCNYNTKPFFFVRSYIQIYIQQVGRIPISFDNGVSLTLHLLSPL